MVPIGEWLAKHGSPIGFLLCSSPIKTLRHCLWDCAQAQNVLDRVTHLLAACEVELWKEHHRGALRLGSITLLIGRQMPLMRIVGAMHAREAKL